MSVSGRFFESPLLLGSAPRKRGIPSAVGKEALLMRVSKPQGHSSERRSPCEINHLFGGASCVEAAKEKVDGLLLCERHALEVKLEGQIACWGGLLFHIDLWSREASRREREDVVGLLEDQRIEATSGRQKAYAIWMCSGARGPGNAEAAPPTRGSLLLLPPRGARPLARGLRRQRRR